MKAIHTPSSRPFRTFFATVAVLAALTALPAVAQEGEPAAGPAIEGAEQACLARIPYPLVDAAIEPAGELRARVYFRAAQHPDFYMVEMAPGATGNFEGILPVPAPETERVVYYVEAIAAAGGDARTGEVAARVVEEREECEEPIFAGADPGIVVHATTEGAAALPPGFLPTGVAQTVSAGGVVASVTPGTVAAAGGLGAAATAGIVAGGAAAGAVIIDQVEEDDESTIMP
jgi:hypothetical protein